MNQHCAKQTVNAWTLCPTGILDIHVHVYHTANPKG